MRTQQPRKHRAVVLAAVAALATVLLASDFAEAGRRSRRFRGNCTQPACMTNCGYGVGTAYARPAYYGGVSQSCCGSNMYGNGLVNSAYTNSNYANANYGIGSQWNTPVNAPVAYSTMPQPTQSWMMTTPQIPQGVTMQSYAVPQLQASTLSEVQVFDQAAISSTMNDDQIASPSESTLTSDTSKQVNQQKVFDRIEALERELNELKQQIK